MSWATSEVVAVLTFLLPGFVGAAAFYSLTSHPKPGEFDRVVQALVFTTVGQAISWVARLIVSVWVEYQWPEGLELTVAVLSAVVVALLVVYCSNHDTAHGLLRRVGLTRETSYPSEWYSAFAENPDCYVVLYLKNERHLYGWPEEWPSNPDEGHVILSECAWEIGDERIPLQPDSMLIISAADVKSVEFLGVPTKQ